MVTQRGAHMNGNADHQRISEPLVNLDQGAEPRFIVRDQVGKIEPAEEGHRNSRRAGHQPMQRDRDDAVALFGVLELSHGSRGFPSEIESQPRCSSAAKLVGTARGPDGARMPWMSSHPLPPAGALDETAAHLKLAGEL